jgi:hypothetical protein
MRVALRWRLAEIHGDSMTTIKHSQSQVYDRCTQVRQTKPLEQYRCPNREVAQAMKGRT